jgi:phospholipid N-methyltransferase
MMMMMMPIKIAEKNQENLRIGRGLVVIRFGLSPTPSQQLDWCSQIARASFISRGN